MRRLLLLLFLAYWLFIFVLTHIPKPPPPPNGINDKGAHYLAYGTLAGLLFLNARLSPRRFPLSQILLGVLLIGAAYGAIDEWTQPWFGRVCDLRDWLADCAGTATALALLSVIEAIRTRLADRSSSSN